MVKKRGNSIFGAMVSIQMDDLNSCLYLLNNFPFASDPADETMLDEFIAEHYQPPAEEWGEYEIKLRVNHRVELLVGFDEHETRYYLNDVFAGNSGGHFCLSLLTWNEFRAITGDSDLLFMLLLPFVVGDKGEKETIRQEIIAFLQRLPFKPEHVPRLAVYLTNHTVFEHDEETMFYRDEQLGLVCKRNHSMRNKLNEAEDIIRLNAVIALAANK